MPRPRHATVFVDWRRYLGRPVRLSVTEDTPDRLGFALNDRHRGEDRRIRREATLLPVLQSSQIERDAVLGEIALGLHVVPFEADLKSIRETRILSSLL